MITIEEVKENNTNSNLCACGCGQPCKKRFKQGHYLKYYLKNNKHYNNKGCKIKNPDGYIMVYCPNHPSVSKSTHYIMEHRLVMEKHLGRYLENYESIHHINEIKDDNRIENLHLYSNSEHTILHNRVDMNSRSCLICNSKKTSISNKGRPIWSKYNNGFLCVKCYRKKHYHDVVKYRY